MGNTRSVTVSDAKVGEVAELREALQEHTKKCESLEASIARHRQAIRDENGQLAEAAESRKEIGEKFKKAVEALPKNVRRLIDVPEEPVASNGRKMSGKRVSFEEKEKFARKYLKTAGGTATVREFNAAAKRALGLNQVGTLANDLAEKVEAITVTGQPRNREIHLA